MIAAAYVHGGTVRHEFMVCLQDLVLRERRIAAIIQSQGPYIPQNRNMVCEKFLQLPPDVKVEWLWFFDIDIEFGPEILDKLLKVADPVKRPIVGALYLNQVPMKPPGTWWPVWADEEGRVEEVVMGEVYDLKVVGMGCTLIHRSVIEKLHATHTDDPWRWFGHDILYREGIPERVGEDETFCSRAISAGFSVHGLAELVTHHKHVPIGARYLEGLTMESHERAAAEQNKPVIPKKHDTLAAEKARDPHSVGTAKC
jgi:hypothetical protein